MDGPLYREPSVYLVTPSEQGGADDIKADRFDIYPEPLEKLRALGHNRAALSVIQTGLRPDGARKPVGVEHLIVTDPRFGDDGTETALRVRFAAARRLSFMAYQHYDGIGGGLAAPDEIHGVGRLVITTPKNKQRLLSTAFARAGEPAMLLPAYLERRDALPSAGDNPSIL
jgi:hypothetical protein